MNKQPREVLSMEDQLKRRISKAERRAKRRLARGRRTIRPATLTLHAQQGPKEKKVDPIRYTIYPDNTVYAVKGGTMRRVRDEAERNRIIQMGIDAQKRQEERALRGGGAE